MELKTGPLANIVVIEATRRPSGQFAGMLLSDFGAEVIQLEPTRDESRDLRTAVFNRGKASWALPAKESVDSYVETLAPLFERAHVVLDDTLTRWPDPFRRALDHLKQKHRLVAVNLSLFAPGREPRAADGRSVEALSGLMHLGGTFEREGPVYLPIATADYVGGCLAAVVAAAGIVKGAAFAAEFSEVAAGLNAQVNKAVYLNEIRDTRKDDPLQQVTPLVRYYQAADGWLVFCAPTMKLFIRVCEAIDRLDLLVDPHAEGAPWVFSDEDKAYMVETLGEIFREQPLEYWMGRFQEAGVIGAPALTREQFMNEHPQVKAEELVVTVEDPRLGACRQADVVARFATRPIRVRRGAPRWGERGATLVADLVASRPPRQPQPLSPGELPLSGIKVLDISNFIAGPLACRNLAALGAEVIKMEPLDGDPWRPLGFSFSTVNRGRRGLSIDLSTAHGREILEKLVVQSDVAVTNLTERIATQQGVTNENLRRINPGIVFCQVVGWGSKGPLAGRPGMDPQFQAVSGYSLTQGGGSVPRLSSATPVDIMSGCVASFAIVAALANRALRGEGDYVETSLLQGSIAAQYGEFLDFAGRSDPEWPRDPLGVRALDRLYRCADGRWVYLVVQERAGWEALKQRTGWDLDRWSPEEALETPVDSPLAAYLAELLERREAAYWETTLADDFVTCLRAFSTVDFARQFSSYFEVVEQPPFGPLIQPGWPASIHEQRLTLSRAPLLGEHTGEILRELGYADEEIARFGEKRIVYLEQFA